MRISFDEQSLNYIEVLKDGDKVKISLSSVDPSNTKKRVVPSVELTQDQFKELISDISFD